MPVTMIPSFLLYCFVAGITPGPANLCSLSAAMRYGKRVAFRQWRGLFTGFFIDSMAAVLINRLLGSVLNQYVGILSWVGAAYILWLAWHMLRSSSGEAENDVTYPCFRTGLLVQLTNVKVIIFCITALSSFVLPYTACTVSDRCLPAFYRSFSEPGLAVCRSLPAKTVCRPSPGCGYCDGDISGSVCMQSCMALKTKYIETLL